MKLGGSIFAPLALFSLSMVPASLAAQDAASDVRKASATYQQTLDCSVIYTFIAGASNGETSAIADEKAKRWLMIAIDRSGMKIDATIAEYESDVDSLITAIEATETEAEGEAMITKRLDACDVLEAANKVEFDAVELEEEDEEVEAG